MASTTSLGFPVVDNVGADSSMLVCDLLQLIVGSGDDSLVNLVEVEILKRANKNAKTTEEWMADTSTVIAAGEFGYATDTKQIKFGDGLNVWANLPEQEMGVADNSVTTEKVVDNAVTNVKLGVMPANTIKGNNTDGEAAPADIPAADILKMIGGQEVIQYAEMPNEASQGAVIQYIGITNENYINGAWYRRKNNEWVLIPVTGGVYVGSGEMPDGYNLQIDPDGDAFSVEEIVDTTLEQAKASGEFDGYTPQRGTDYWTDEDIAEIKRYVDEAILGGAW